MQSKFERFAKFVYKRWKLDLGKSYELHPDEETLACFLDDKLSRQESEDVRKHLLSCDACMEALILNAKFKDVSLEDVPQELLNHAKGLLASGDKFSLLEAVIKLKEKAIEIINTTGDVLLGQEFIPAPVLRSRQIRDFKDEVTILKDFPDVRVEAKIENKGQQAFSLVIVAKQKQTQKLIKDLRVTLFKADTELESYLTDSGTVKFEHVQLGKYMVEISSPENKLASIALDVRL